MFPMRRAHFSHCNALALFTCKLSARTQNTSPQAPTPPQAPTQHCNITTPAHSHSSRKPKSQTTFAHHKRQSTKPLQHHFAPTHLCTAPGRQTAARPQHRQSNPATHRQHTKAQPPGNTTPPPNDPAHFWRKRSRQTHAPEQKKCHFYFPILDNWTLVF